MSRYLNRKKILMSVIIIGVILICNYCFNMSKYNSKTVFVNDKKLLKENSNTVTRLNVLEEDDYILSSNKYQINEGYIYYGADRLGDVKGNMTCTNCNLNVSDNKLQVIYDGNIVKTYNLVGVASTKYDLTKEYIFNSDINLIHEVVCTNCDLSVDNKKLLVKYGNVVVGSYDLVNLTTRDYLLLDEYIYHGFKDSVDTSKIACQNCNIVVDNHKLIVKYGNETVKEYTFLGLTTNYKMKAKTIYVLTDFGDDEAIINKIDKGVCALEIQDNKLLLVKYNNNVIDTYHIAIDENIFFAQDYIIDENRMILYRTDGNLSAGSFLLGVETNGIKNIIGKRGIVLDDNSKICTGYFLRVTFEDDPDNPVEYKISVRGDVLGTGGPSLDNSKTVAKHVIDKNVIDGDEYLMAADYNGDKLIKMNDAVKMLKDMEQENLLSLIP